jgi:hypothetical protein
MSWVVITVSHYSHTVPMVPPASAFGVILHHSVLALFIPSASLYRSVLGVGMFYLYSHSQ